MRQAVVIKSSFVRVKSYLPTKSFLYQFSEPIMIGNQFSAHAVQLIYQLPHIFILYVAAHAGKLVHGHPCVGGAVIFGKTLVLPCEMIEPLHPMAGVLVHFLQVVEFRSYKGAHDSNVGIAGTYVSLPDGPCSVLYGLVNFLVQTVGQAMAVSKGDLQQLRTADLA
jgi:hypothetical protein